MSREATRRFSPEVRERAVRMALEHEKEYASRWAAACSVAAKIGCTGQTLNEWVKKAEVDGGTRAGIRTEMAEKMKALESAGVTVVKNPAEIGNAVKKALGR